MAYLSNTLVKARREGQDIGSLDFVLSDYQRLATANAYAMVAAIEFVKSAFSPKVAGSENDDQVDKHEMIEELQIQMLKAAEELEFEKAAQLRDKIATLKGEKVATPQIKKKRFKKR